MITQSQILNLIPTGINPIINVTQYDYGSRTLQFPIYNGTSEFTLTSSMAARIQGTKPDGHGFDYAATINTANNIVVADLTQQMTAVSGNVKCEIVLTKSGERIGTLNFILKVQSAGLNDETVVSDSELPDIIAQATAQMEAAAASASQAAASATSASTSATNAASSATSAANSATSASNSASSASDSATSAEESADRAEAYSVNVPYIGANGNWWVWNTTQGAYIDSGVDASITVRIADITMLAYNATPYVTNTGTDTDPIFHLFIPRGASVASCEKTSTSGLVDTYTMTFTDGATTTFTVTNARSISSITKTGTSGLVDTYTIAYNDGTTSTFNVTNGRDGTGTGDMEKADYDDTEEVLNAGGIVDYVAAQLSGFSQNLSGLSDVALASLASGQALIYDATTQKWVNGSISASNVDYANTTSSLTATDAQGAIDEVAAEIQTLTNEVDTIVNVLGAKNLLKNTASSATVNGITFTVNDDGSVTVNGTATENAFIRVANITEKTCVLNKGKYTFNGCPAGGSLSGYYAYATDNTTSFNDIGNGVDFTISSDNTPLAVIIYVKNGTTVSNLTFYPMIRLASIEDDTYEPYAKTNQQLTQDTTGLLDNTEVNGAVNMLPNNATSQVVNGITYIVNSDGSITVSGTATAESWCVLNVADMPIEAGNYILTGCPEDGSIDSFILRVSITDGNNTINCTDRGNGGNITVPNGYKYRSYTGIRVASGAAITTPITFKPMLTVASYNGDYVPYAKSNRELTEKVSIVTGTVTPITNTKGTLNSTYTALHKIGHLALLDFVLTVDSTETWTTIGSIDLTPLLTVRIILAEQTGGNDAVKIQLNTSKEIRISSGTVGKQYEGQLVFLTND